MRRSHGNGLNPKIDNQNISLISTVHMLVNLHGEINSVSFSKSRSVKTMFVITLGSHLKRPALVVGSRVDVVTLCDHKLRVARFSCGFFTVMAGNKARMENQGFSMYFYALS